MWKFEFLFSCPNRTVLLNPNVNFFRDFSIFLSNISLKGKLKCSQLLVGFSNPLFFNPHGLIEEILHCSDSWWPLRNCLLVVQHTLFSIVPWQSSISYNQRRGKVLKFLREGQGQTVVRRSSDGTGLLINLPKSGGGRGNCYPCQHPTTAGPVMQDQPDAARHTVGQSNQECKETSEPNVRVM